MVERFGKKDSYDGSGMSRLEGEMLRKFRPLNDKEKILLINDGKYFFASTGGVTIESQRRAGKKLGFVDGGEEVLNLPSMTPEVAIPRDPDKFFISGSRNKSLSEQEELAEEEGKKLRIRLGGLGLDFPTNHLTVVVSEQAVTLTELVFRYHEETGIWLFGKEYGYLSGRAKNLIKTKSGFASTNVGVGSDGLAYVDSFDAEQGNLNIAAPYLVVASIDPVVPSK